MPNLQQIANLEDLRQAAKKRLPHPVFSYVDCAAYDETTRIRNSEDLKQLRFKQRGLVDISTIETKTALLGSPARAPVAIAPTGMGGIVTGGQGEIPIIKAAQSFGIPYIQGWLSMSSIEEVAEKCAPVWFQILFLKDRGLMQSLIERAHSAKSPVLVLTITSPIVAICPRVYRTGLSIPPKLSVRSALSFAVKPAWSLRTLFGKSVRLGNLPAGTGMADAVGMLDPSATWKDIAWLRSIWPGKLVIKGIGNPADAVSAVEAGADGLVVSTHGGFTLDSAASSISVLPHIAEAVAGRCEILFDSGIRSGQDVLKALALGASGCLMGRSPLYAAAAYGEAGVHKALELLEMELKVTAGLTGLRNANDASPDILWSDWPRNSL